MESSVKAWLKSEPDSPEMLPSPSEAPPCSAFGIFASVESRLGLGGSRFAVRATAEKYCIHERVERLFCVCFTDPGGQSLGFQKLRNWTDRVGVVHRAR